MKKQVFYLFLTLTGLALTLPALGSDTLYDNRFKQWQKQAAKGNARAQYSLGNAYLRGNEVPLDMDKAVEWFERAAGQGHAKSEYKLGFLYYTGKGVKRSYRDAYNWIKRSAEHGYSPAQFYLGKMYAEGQGVDRNYDRALHWLAKAEAANYGAARTELRRVRSQQAEAKAKNEQQARAEEEARARAKAEATARGVTDARQTQTQPKPANTSNRRVTVAKVTKPRPKKKSGRFDTESLLLDHQWLRNGVPAEFMPSAITQCEKQGSKVLCSSNMIQKSREFADISYKVETIIGKFESNGKFRARHRTNVTFVLPLDPDEDYSPEDVPPTGWQNKTALICHFKNEKKFFCVTDNFERIEFVRK